MAEISRAVPWYYRSLRDSARIKAFVRDLIALVPGVRFWIARWVFLGPNHNTHRFWGVFPTMAAARAYIPSRLNIGFEDPAFPENFDETIPERDAPVVRILSRLMPEVKTVFDLGGNIGFCFYRYRSQITYPQALRWTVCDLPFVNERGKRMAAKRGESQIAFTDTQQEGDGADVYLTCGALQFFEDRFADILRRLKKKPRHVLINRVPLTEGSSFFTLQHSGYSVVPYHIANLDSFVAGIEALGYKLVEQWENDRFCDILLRPDRYVRHYYGFYFMRI